MRNEAFNGDSLQDGLVPELFIDEETGNLGVIEFKKLDFVPRRLYWITNFKPGTLRGHHAHKTLRQAFFVIKGSIDIELFKGSSKETLTLTPDSNILEIGPGIWRVMRNGTPNTALLVLADQPYSESDYIRDWDEYLVWFENKK